MSTWKTATPNWATSTPSFSRPERIEKDTMNYFGIDVGCTSIKHGQVSFNEQIETADFDMTLIPQTMRTEKYTDAILGLLKSAPKCQGVGIGFPTVVWEEGLLNLEIKFNDIWVKTNQLANELQLPCFALNDADAAGFAELYNPGAAELRRGVTIVLTLGTGIGSAMFLNGQLLPNTEMGMMKMADGIDIELTAAPSVKRRDNLTMEDWAGRLQAFISHLEIIFSPDHIILGGGISTDYEEYRPFLSTKRARLGPAYYRNQAGVVGAAMYAAYCCNQHTLF
jgi:polyphosphate glucokinase